MKFSVWPGLANPPSDVFTTARWADAHGWFGVWAADHYMPNTATDVVDDGPTHECWAMLAAIGAVTTTVRIGSLVSPTSVHHPAVLANRASTIDHVSGGRMVLGLGAGWQVNEHAAYGIELESPGRRVQRFDEAIQIVRSLLAEPRTTFDGEVFRIIDAPCEPKPIQSPLPILVGTSSPRMLRITARHADEWNTWGDLALSAQRRSEFERGCEAVGRDPKSMHTSVQALVAVTTDTEARRAALEGPFASRIVAGSPQQISDTFGRYRELGFDEFIVPDFNLGRTIDQRLEALLTIDAIVRAL